MKPLFSLIFLFAFGLLTFAQDADQLRFAKIISNNMVLQQQKPISLWGWAKPKTEVSVILTQDAKVGEAAWASINDSTDNKQDNGTYSVTMRYVEKNPPKLATQMLKTKAGNDGRWSVQFPAAKASFQPTWIIAQAAQELSLIHI